jgi:hypothetical protein
VVDDRLPAEVDRIGEDHRAIALAPSRTALVDPATDVTGDDPHVTGKIALAHLNEFPDYYTRLERMEGEARREFGER